MEEIGAGNQSLRVASLFGGNLAGPLNIRKIRDVDLHYRTTKTPRGSQTPEQHDEGKLLLPLEDQHDHG